MYVRLCVCVFVCVYWWLIQPTDLLCAYVYLCASQSVGWINHQGRSEDLFLIIHSCRLGVHVPAAVKSDAIAEHSKQTAQPRRVMLEDVSLSPSVYSFDQADQVRSQLRGRATH